MGINKYILIDSDWKHDYQLIINLKWIIYIQDTKKKLANWFSLWIRSDYRD